MKRFVLLLVCVFLFSACDSFVKHDFDITNDSDYTVSFTLAGYGDSVRTLASGEMATFDLFDHPTIVFSGHPRVTYISKASSASIFNLTAYDITIYNDTEKTVTVKEKDYLLGSESDDATGISVENGNSIGTTLYTQSPTFEIVDADGTTHEYDFTEAYKKDGDTSTFLRYELRIK